MQKNISNILNVEIDNISRDELLAQLKKGVLVTPNVDQMVKMQSDRNIIRSHVIITMQTLKMYYS